MKRFVAQVNVDDSAVVIDAFNHNRAIEWFSASDLEWGGKPFEAAKKRAAALNVEWDQFVIEAREEADGTETF